MKQKLDNYLLTHRKRSGLSQEEVAFLLGHSSGTHVSRHERRTRCPNLETLLAYECILQASVRDLFAGVYQRVEHQIQKRAEALGERLALNERSPMTEHKLAVLKRISSSEKQDGKGTI